MKYYKDQGDGYYIVPEGADVTIPDNWIEISEAYKKRAWQ